MDSAILLQRLQEGRRAFPEMADWWNGTLGHARKFFDLPGAFVVPISTSLLPVLSRPIAGTSARWAGSPPHGAAGDAAHQGALFGGYGHFLRPICQLLLYNQPEVAQRAAATDHAQRGYCVQRAAVYHQHHLQSFGRATRPVVNMAVGGVVKVVLSYVLIGIPQVAAKGSTIQHGGELCGDGGHSASLPFAAACPRWTAW